MNIFTPSRSLLLALAATAIASAVSAAEPDPVRVGVIVSTSGPFSSIGGEITAGIKTYMKEHGDTVAGRKIEIIVKDTTGPSPEIAKRLAQELVVREKVEFLAGFGLTPEALAVAPIATEAKTPMIIMNAATSIITTKSPYIARVSFTLPQVAGPMATWAAKNGVHQVYTLVSDYGPGIDAETEFKKTFTAAGGKIADSVRVPLQNPDFSPYVQRIKDVRPQAVFVFVPAGQQGIAFMKTFAERGVAQAGVKVIATGDVTEDYQLDAMGDPALGIITTHHYSAAHDSPENKAFLKAFRDANGGTMRANFMAVGGYDGMAAIYEVVRRLKGRIDADKAMEVLKGLKLASPRGALVVDPETRDPIQTVYVRRVEKVDGHLYNVEFDKFPNVRDPGK
jgi:branched-chain amino acid transport system substrate-binding protein